MIVGGHPGEWEGEHPRATVASARRRGVLLAGWHDQVELPAFLSRRGRPRARSVASSSASCSSRRWRAGCHRSRTASARREIVADGETGWLVPVEDRAALAEALDAALADPAERARRGAAAARDAAERFSWPAIAGHVADVLRDAAATRPEAPRRAASAS